jgi:hypothetical protein
MTHCMDIMEDYFALRGYSGQFLRLDGSTKVDERNECVRLWNLENSQFWLFILSTKAGGLGLNLQTADTVIIFDTDWNPQADLQAQARAHRIGSKHDVHVFQLVSHNSVEEKILETATWKLGVDAKVIQAGMFNSHSNDKMRKAMLETLLKQEKDEEEIEILTSSEQINTTIARNDEEFEMYQKMDQERDEELDRLWRLKGNTGPRPPRLVSKEELPETLVNWKPSKEEYKLGRGHRERGEVNYTIDLPEEENSGSEDSAPTGSRKRKGTQTADNGKKLKEDSLQVKCQELLKVITDAADSEGRSLSAIFKLLPSKKDYPHYYDIIKKPIALKNISKTAYPHASNFCEDFLRMFKNAQEFNEEMSYIYQDSVVLQHFFLAEALKFFKNIPETVQFLQKEQQSAPKLSETAQTVLQHLLSQRPSETVMDTEDSKQEVEDDEQDAADDHLAFGDDEEINIDDDSPQPSSTSKQEVSDDE